MTSRLPEQKVDGPRGTQWYCEACDEWLKWENLDKHPNGLGGHVVIAFPDSVDSLEDW